MVPWEPLLLSPRIVNQLSLIETSQHPKSFSYRLPNEWLVLVVDFSHGGAIVLGLLLRDATSEGKPQMEQLDGGWARTPRYHSGSIQNNNPRQGTWKECAKKMIGRRRKGSCRVNVGGEVTKTASSPASAGWTTKPGFNQQKVGCLGRALLGVEETSHAYTAWSVNNNHRLRQAAAPLNSLEFWVMFSYSQI